MNAGVLNLPKKVLIYALSFLSRKDLENCLLTCKRFRECTYQNLGKELFRGLTDRTVENFINGPYLDLVGDYVMPIGWRTGVLDEFKTFWLKFTGIEARVMLRAIEITQLSKTKEILTEIFSLAEEIRENLSVVKVCIGSLKSLNHLLELEKSIKIPMTISVSIPMKDNLNLWKERLEELPEEIKVYALGFYECYEAETIKEMCKNLGVKSLSLWEGLRLNLSDCRSLFEVTVNGHDYTDVDLILPGQLKLLKIDVWEWNGKGVDGSRCTALSRCDIASPKCYGKIILSKSIKDTVILTSKRDKDVEWNIEWV